MLLEAGVNPNLDLPRTWTGVRRQDKEEHAREDGPEGGIRADMVMRYDRNANGEWRAVLAIDNTAQC